MKADLVERLRKVHEQRGRATPLADIIPICQEAADALDELRDALEGIYDYARQFIEDWEQDVNRSDPSEADSYDTAVQSLEVAEELL